MNNFWNNIARSTVRELARAAGLRSSNEQAVQDLTTKYGLLPTPEFVDEMWLVLRDGWLTRSAPHRQAVVERMRDLGRADMKLKAKTRSEQLAYLRTLRRSPVLSETVLQVFLDSGSQERQPPVFVEPPADPEEQATWFFALIRERLLRLDESTMEGFERAVHSAIHSAVATLTLPVGDPLEAAKRIVVTVASSFMIAVEPEPTGVRLRKYQRVMLDRLADRLPDVDATQRLFDMFTGSLVKVLGDPQSTGASVADFTSALFMAVLAFESANEAPPGFVNEIATAQRRFVGHGGLPGAGEQSTQERRGFDEALAEVMSRIPNSTAAADIEDGAIAWTVFMGSAAVQVIREPFFDGHPTVVQFVAKLVKDVELSSDLATTLNLVNVREPFYKVYWENNAVWQVYQVAVNNIDEGVFQWLLQRFAGAADYFDTMFRNRYGGVMVSDDKQAVFDA